MIHGTIRWGLRPTFHEAAALEAAAPNTKEKACTEAVPVPGNVSELVSSDRWPAAFDAWRSIPQPAAGKPRAALRILRQTSLQSNCRALRQRTKQCRFGQLNLPIEMPAFSTSSIRRNAPCPRIAQSSAAHCAPPHADAPYFR